MSDSNAAPALTSDVREQPFLYSWNRRLRHLHGISLRNLDITPPTGRLRGKTVTEDDSDILTPAALLAREDQRLTIHQSKSFDNLPRAEAALTLKLPTKDQSQYGKRPGRLRRRSTMHWGSANPRQRQQKLEDVALNRLCDTWFSIHIPTVEDPVYISEVMEKAMNPSFSFFDLDQASATVARSDEFKIRIWAKSAHVDQYTELLDLTVNLRSLQFIGKSLDNFHHPLPQNCVLFHLSDGIYTSFTDLPAEHISEPRIRANQRSAPAVNTSSYDVLMKLANLDDCIQDALHMREKLEADINALLAKNKQNLTSPEQIQSKKDSVKRTKMALTAEQSQVDRLGKRKEEVQQSRDARKAAIQEATRVQRDLVKVPELLDKKIATLRSSMEKEAEQAAGQVRRICEELLRIYPIEPVKNRSLQFTIRNIHLPNSVFDDTNRDEIAAALGYTGHLVHQLSLYLSITMPYPIDPNGSSTTISDPISFSLAQRRFPLHPTNVSYKFEYGVFLLNKNIEFLLNRCGLRVMDIRHTLPNLKYLLYVLTAGTSELPARKAGGIRGLWGGSITPSLSRTGSDDSVVSQKSADGTNGSTVVTGKEKGPDISDGLGQGPGRLKALPYRRSMLREAG